MKFSTNHEALSDGLISKSENGVPGSSPDLQLIDFMMEQFRDLPAKPSSSHEKSSRQIAEELITSDNHHMKEKLPTFDVKNKKFLIDLSDMNNSSKLLIQDLVSPITPVDAMRRKNPLQGNAPTQTTQTAHPLQISGELPQPNLKQGPTPIFSVISENEVNSAPLGSQHKRKFSRFSFDEETSFVDSKIPIDILGIKAEKKNHHPDKAKHRMLRRKILDEKRKKFRQSNPDGASTSLLSIDDPENDNITGDLGLQHATKETSEALAATRAVKKRAAAMRYRQKAKDLVSTLQDENERQQKDMEEIISKYKELQDVVKYLVANKGSPWSPGEEEWIRQELEKCDVMNLQKP